MLLNQSQRRECLALAAKIKQSEAFVSKPNDIVATVAIHYASKTMPTFTVYYNGVHFGKWIAPVIRGMGVKDIPGNTLLKHSNDFIQVF